MINPAHLISSAEDSTLQPHVNMQYKALQGAALRLPLRCGEPQNGDRDCIGI